MGTYIHTDLHQSMKRDMMRDAYKIQVLMSTFNGERYLRDQLDSIFKQQLDSEKYLLSLLVRDDGSTDHTISILSEYVEKHPEMRYYVGDNKGAVHSFFQLVNDADPEADFYAFADQDDWWFPDKVQVAVDQCAQHKGIPFLYFCNAELTNDQLVSKNRLFHEKPVKPSFGNALVENIIPGCSMVMNRELLSLVRNNTPEYAIMHDWWFYLVASCFGEVKYDPIPRYYYRQHERNEIGKNTFWITELKSRVLRFSENRGRIYHQLFDFRQRYEKKLEPFRKELVTKLIENRFSFRRRLKLVFDKEYKRQHTLDNVLWKAILILGSY